MVLPEGRVAVALRTAASTVRCTDLSAFEATAGTASLVRLMGSLIKKRRKRMRKKKHKKMLKRTRFQRRASK